MKLVPLLSCSALIALISACGGGGDTVAPATVVVTPTTTNPILTDKYTATWKSCRNDGLLRTLVITKKSESIYAVSFNATAHDGGYPCAGEGTPIPDTSGIGEFQIVGTKEVFGSTAGTVDKIIDPANGEKDIFFVKDGVVVTDSKNTVTVLYYGSSSSTIDSDGFPNLLDTINPFRKQ